MSGNRLTESHQVSKEEGSASEEPTCPPQGPENEDSGPLNSCQEASFLRLFEGCFSSALPKCSPGITRAKGSFREPQVKKKKCRTHSFISPPSPVAAAPHSFLLDGAILREIRSSLWDLPIVSLAISSPAPPPPAFW